MPMSKETGKMQGAMDGSQLGDTLLCSCPWVWAPVYKPGVAAQPAIGPGEVEIGHSRPALATWKVCGWYGHHEILLEKKIKQKQSMR